jgi:hypothetical protein
MPLDPGLRLAREAVGLVVSGDPAREIVVLKVFREAAEDGDAPGGWLSALDQAASSGRVRS